MYLCPPDDVLSLKGNWADDDHVVLNLIIAPNYNGAKNKTKNEVDEVVNGFWVNRLHKESMFNQSITTGNPIESTYPWMGMSQIEVGYKHHGDYTV